MDALAKQYALVLLSRRSLRALAAATFNAAAMLFGMALVLPLGLAVIDRGRNGKLWALPLVALLVGVVGALAIGLTMAYVRILAALAAGSKRAVTMLLVVVLTVARAIGLVDVYQAFGPDVRGPLPYAFVIAALSASFVIIRLILVAGRRCRMRARRLAL